MAIHSTYANIFETCNVTRSVDALIIMAIDQRTLHVSWWLDKE
jgi:hypothetical protein